MDDALVDRWHVLTSKESPQQAARYVRCVADETGREQDYK
jgi:hypothetical protein